MTIRLIINLVRWSWGLQSYDFVGNMTEYNLSCLMFYGAIVDVFVIFGIVYFAISIFKCFRRRR